MFLSPGSGLIGRKGKRISISPAPLDFRNILYANGSLEVWQRGAGGAASISVASNVTSYTADRWALTTGVSGASHTVAQVAGITTQSRWAAAVQRVAAQTGVAKVYFEYPLTVDECVALRGQNITVQFYVSTGALWSPASGTINVNAYFGTGTEGKRNVTAYTAESNPLTTTFNVAAGSAAAQKIFAGAATVATNVTQGCLQFSWTPVGTAGATDTVNFDEVQLETGLSVTPIERLSFAESLRECQRHYCKTFNYATAPAQNVGLTGAAYGIDAGNGANALTTSIQWRYPAAMRSAPTITTYNPSAANAQVRGLLLPGDNTLTVSTAGTEGVNITATSTSNGNAAGAAAVHIQADAGL